MNLKKKYFLSMIASGPHVPVYSFNYVRSLPRTLVDTRASLYGTDIYIFGGYTHTGSNAWVSYIYKFDTISETTTTLATQMPTTNANMGICTYGDYIYIFGGRANNSNKNIIWRFDCINETIETLQNTLPVAMNDATAIVYGSYIYILWNYTIYRFDPATESTINLSIAIDRYAQFAWGILGDNVYLIGGGVTTIQKYNITSGTVTTIATVLGSELRYPTFGQIDDNIYIIGGRVNSTYTNAIYMFNMTSETLTTLSITSNICAGAGNATINNKVYQFGGRSGNTASNIYSSIYRFKVD